MTIKATRTKDIALELSVKAFTDTGSGEVEGYASVFNNIDQHREVIEPGAFAKTLQMNKGKVRFLWQHDRYQPIGAIVELREDAKGLYFKAKFANTPKGQEARELLKMEGAMGGFSIGFQIIQEVIDELTGIVRIKEIRLLEVSAVTFPCNEASVVIGVKSEEVLTDDESALLDRFKSFLVAQREKEEAPQEQVAEFGHSVAVLEDAPANLSEATQDIEEETPPEVEDEAVEPETDKQEEALIAIKESLEVALLLDTLRAAKARP